MSAWEGHRLGETIDYLKTFARFPFGLRRFARQTLTLEAARRIVRDRFERREEEFVQIAERSIYGFKRSPYLALLKRAGCELGDLRDLVRRRGLEGALRELRRQGVYVTYEEFKGRIPIVRGDTTIAVAAHDFDNPSARGDLAVQTGSSTGVATAVGVHLDFLTALTPPYLLALDAHGLVGAPYVAWQPALPGPGFALILQSWHIGLRHGQWFMTNGWRESKYWLKYDLATIYSLICSRLLRVQVPWPGVVRLDEAEKVARYVASALQATGRCFVMAGVSRALRISLAAEQAGIDLTGAVFSGGGEPASRAKLEGIQRVGARMLGLYGTVEAGQIAYGCASLADETDTHLANDAFALITHPHVIEGVGLTVPALNITSLLDTAPKLLFNVEIDDYGVVEERRCGCELEACGYTTHLSGIGSYSKLVGEGVTLIGNEMLNILEQVLPARFGGSPQDYQLMEEEDGQGLTRLFLLIHPRVQIADSQEVLDVMHAALRQSSPMADAARVLWQQAQTIQIKRMEPVWTGGRKLMPLYIRRRQQQS